MVGASLISAAFAAAMAIPRLPIPVLLLMIVGIGAVAPFFSGIRTAVLTEVLHGPSYMLGVSLMGMVAQFSQVAGYAFGGLLLAVISPGQALLIRRRDVRGRGCAPAVRLPEATAPRRLARSRRVP